MGPHLSMKFRVQLLPSYPSFSNRAYLFIHKCLNKCFVLFMPAALIAHQDSVCTEVTVVMVCYMCSDSHSMNFCGSKLK